MRNVFLTLMFVLLGVMLIFPQFVQAVKIPDELVLRNQIGSDQRVLKETAEPNLTKFDGKGVKPDIDFGRIPLYFTANKGQVNENARFYAKASRYTLWLTREGLVFDSTLRIDDEDESEEGGDGPMAEERRWKHGKPTFREGKYARDVSRLMFLNANKTPEMVPVDEAQLKVNYFIGKDKSKWHCGVPTSKAVLYKRLYKGIDLKVYGKEKQIEYDWIIKPGGSPGDIRFEYRNVKGTRIDEAGNLLIETDFGELMHQKPVSYQVIGEERKDVNAVFKKIGKNTYGFEVGAYDRNRELIIDPVVLVYSTYLGGRDGGEGGSRIAVDDCGNVYVTGTATCTDFPTLNQYQQDQPSLDALVVRLDTTQSGAASLIYSTYLGGRNGERGYDIAIDGKGKAYVTGETISPDFPTLNQYQGHQGGMDAFVTILDTNRSGVSSLIYSTYFGGGNYDEGDTIALDGNGNVYIAGSTKSTNLSILNQYQTYQGGHNCYDVFVAMLDTTRSGVSCLRYSTYLGGGNHDSCSGIAVDGNGYVYVMGNTESRDFPTRKSYQAYHQGVRTRDHDLFVTVLNTTLSGASSLIYSTYLGGENHDIGKDIAIDGKGNVYVVGITKSRYFPTRNQCQTYQGEGLYVNDVFVARLDTTLSGASSLIYSTYLGGKSHDAGNDIAIDGNGNVYVLGGTQSPDFPILNQYQPYQSSYPNFGDIFITRFSAAAPTVDTPTSTNITYTTATLGGNIVRANGANPVKRGIYWSLTNGFTPPAQGTKVSRHGKWGTGPFTIPVTGLPAGSVIYFKAFATNSAGTGYSTQDSFNTPAVMPPTITTVDVSNITAYSADSGGNVISDGGAAVTARGVCWNTSTNPTTADSHTTEGTGVGTFTSSLTGLSPGTAYFVRAYATNSVGTSYGSEKTFTTITVAPTVTTAAVSDITLISASSGGNVTANGGAAVTARGVCWSASANPTTADNHTEDETGLGSFTSSLTGLTPNTTYHVRAYATNAVGTAYGGEVTFSTQQLPHIRLSRTGFNFGSIISGPQTGPQEFLVANSGGWFLDWTATPSEPWIKVSPSTGSADMLVTLSVDAADLAPGSYTGTVSIADNNADNSPVTVDVFLEVKQESDEQPLIGSFDSPPDGAAVFSSVPFSGWALDDTEVSTVKIYRNALLPQERGLVYVGDAVMVDGLRPDIEGKYPDYPKSYLAGWGYLMLTNGLPNGGNGTYVITAIGTDNSGNKVTLGSKTITCDNASAVKPFGAIDTPTQGGDASGKYFPNFGWALTPLPNTIPTDGSTIKVWVDGLPLAGNPMYNLYREDIAARFPGYNNSDGAVGCYYLDTTAYENGMHSIAWGVVDDAGNAEGIGSRFFRVLNVGNPKNRFNPFPGYGDKLAIDNLPPSLSPVHLKRGYNTSIENTQPTETLYPDKQGLIKITIEEIERIEIKIGTQCLGYLLVDGELRNLPAGSTVDKKRGVFYWQPGPGFLGTYQLVFVVKERNGKVARRIIKIAVKRK